MNEKEKETGDTIKTDNSPVSQVALDMVKNLNNRIEYLTRDRDTERRMRKDADENYQNALDEIERLKAELERRDEEGAEMRNTRGKVYDLWFSCCACNRVSIFTNRIDENKMRCAACSHDEFEIKAIEKEGE